MEGQEEIIKMRNHITSVIEETWGIVLVLICIVLGNGDSFELGLELLRTGNIIEGFLAVGGISILLLIICLWRINRWYRTTLTLKEGNVIYERRTLNRYVNNIAVANISNINLEQNIFERIVGTCKVKLDTNSLSTANQTDLQIVLKKRDAERVKQLLLQMIRENEVTEQGENGLYETAEGLAENQVYRAAGGLAENQVHGAAEIPAEAPVHAAAGRSSSVGLNPLLENHLALDDDRVDFDIVYSTKDIVKNCLVTTYISMWILAAVVCVGIVLMIVEALIEEDNIWDVIGVILFQIMLEGTWLTTLVKRGLQDFKFRARRDGDKIYVSCGLLKKKKYTVPVDKINAVTVEYTFLGRLCKRGYVKVINVGGEGEDVDGMKILLADSYGELERKMKVLLPEFDLPEPSMLKKPPLRVLWLSLGKLALLFAIVIGGMFLGISAGGAIFDLTMEELTDIPANTLLYCCFGGLVLFLVLAGICLLHYLSAGIYQGDNLMLSRGILKKKILTINYQRIQYIHISQGLAERMAGLSRGYFTILASAMSQTQDIGCFGGEEFEEMAERFRQTY